MIVEKIYPVQILPIDVSQKASMSSKPSLSFATVLMTPLFDYYIGQMSSKDNVRRTKGVDGARPRLAMPLPDDEHDNVTNLRHGGTNNDD
jgi:hypothetical protein